MQAATDVLESTDSLCSPTDFPSRLGSTTGDMWDEQGAKPKERPATAAATPAPGAAAHATNRTYAVIHCFSPDQSDSPSALLVDAG